MGASPSLLHEIRIRTQWPGSAKKLACDLGISYGHLLNLRNGNAPIAKPTAKRILAKVREEDLALADRIEEELTQSWREELRRLDQ